MLEWRWVSNYLGPTVYAAGVRLWIIFKHYKFINRVKGIYNFNIISVFPCPRWRLGGGGWNCFTNFLLEKYDYMIADIVHLQSAWLGSLCCQLLQWLNNCTFIHVYLNFLAFGKNLFPQIFDYFQQCLVKTPLGEMMSGKKLQYSFFF